MFYGLTFPPEILMASPIPANIKVISYICNLLHLEGISYD